MSEQPKPQEASTTNLSEIEKLVRQKIKEGKIVGVDRFSEEQKAALIELCVLSANPIAFAARSRELKDTFGVPVRYIEDLVKKIVAKAAPDGIDFQKDDEIIQELVRIALQKATLWHNEFKHGYATIERDGHIENLRVEKQDFQFWLADKFGEEFQQEVNGELVPIYPPPRCIKPALYHIENHARRGEQKDPKVRILGLGDELWIDLGGPDWSAIRVTADGWRIEPRIRVPLVRSAGMLPLPVPDPKIRGDIRDLREFANVRDDAGEVLFCGGIATILNPFGKYLTLILCGPAGSGKTTATRLMRGLTDPNKVDTRRFVSVRDLMHGASNTHVIALENVSEIDDNLSDTICALNTGTGVSERKYYAQGIEWSERPQNPVIINGIPTNLATRSDLLDRTVTFIFDYLGDRVRSDDVFWRKFNLAAPRIFVALLDGLVGYMKVRRDFQGDIDKAAHSLLDGWHPRFVDAVLCGEVACRTMGFAPGQFTDAYKNNQDVGLRYIAENDPICIGIRKLILQFGSWQGYPAELCAAIRPFVGLTKTPNPVTLAKQLPWFIPVLQKVNGIEIVMHKRLHQDDNRNGIIIGVGRGTLVEPKFAGSTHVHSTNVTGFRRRI